MATIEFHQVTKRFGSVQALKELNLEIRDQEFLVLLGPSGCGKTTALRMLAGLEDPSSGTILIDGQDVTQVAPKDRDLAMVFQSYALYPHMTVFDNIGFSLRLRRVAKPEIRERVGDVAHMLGLEGLLDRRPKELSGGQRQRVALGRAVVRRPRAFLMDEPLSNLDAKLRTATRAELTKLHRELQATFVYVTHDQVEAMTMATRIAIMSDGRLQQLGTPAEVYDRPATTFVAQFIGTPPMNLMRARLNVTDGRLMAQGEFLHLELSAAPTMDGQEVLIGVRPEHLLPLAPGDERRRPWIRANVTAVEMLGNEVVVLTEVDGSICAVRGPRSLDLHPGSLVHLTCSPRDLHVFELVSGERLDLTPVQGETREMVLA
ncbi:MAG: ABC transporter ATP-binding protein [Chloroflexota bacterium]